MNKYLQINSILNIVKAYPQTWVEICTAIEKSGVKMKVQVSTTCQEPNNKESASAL